MKLENQVCSLDLSKKLKELGVVQESAFYWCIGGAGEAHLLGCGLEHYERNGKYGDYYKAEDYLDEFKFAAFTVAELGVALPLYIKHSRSDDGTWFSTATVDSLGFRANSGYDDTEANARAKMLVYLIENKIITVEEVNGRLGA
jgi:hypothetical protein